jgi:hypothetical protein
MPLSRRTMKTQYLHQQHAGHGVTFATGTPISNTMVELYTVQRFLDPAGLEARSLAHFDAWAATFGEVVDAMELAPDGASLRPRSRFARFTNLPELQQMFRSYADVQTAAMLHLPRPRLAGDKATVIACPMSEAQCAIQATLVARYEAIRSGQVKPWEDNALAITTDGRKLALDARLLSPTAEDVPGSKINALVENVTGIWQRTTPTRGTQLIFADLGIHPTPWGYSVYQDIVHKLVQHGIPRQEIAAIGDADTDAKKHVLFEQVRQGTVRILLGSTQKMGTGTNVQQRLVAAHSLDCAWKCSEIEQRDGRILRQGNTNAEVAIYRYVTEGSFDAYMWQALETKAKFIAQVLTGDSTVRQAEDIGAQELSYAEVKAIASGNPAVLTLAEADAALHRLHVLQKHHADEQFLARRQLRALPADIARLEHRVAALTQDMATAQAHADEPVTIGTRPYSRHDALEALAARLHALPALVYETHSVPLGLVRGQRFGLVQHPQGAPEVYVEGALRRSAPLARDVHGPRAILNAIERLIGNAAAERDKATRDLAIAQGQCRDYETRVGAGFAHAAYLEALTALRTQLEAALSSTTHEEAEGSLPTVGDLVARLKALHAAHTVEAAPERSALRRTATVEEAITTRIRQREQAETMPQPDEEPSLGVSATPAPQPVITPPPAIPAQARPAPWQPPQQLRLF